jgi:hypothetical protein
MIIPILILGASLLALLQFFIFYCRLQIATGRRAELSETVREVTGIASQKATGDDFPRLKRLVDLCPEVDGDTYRLSAIQAYHAFLGVMAVLCGWAVPSAAAWADHERAGCCHYAAVALDVRIARTRQLFDHDLLSGY